jgi:hypothetical protein
MAEIATMNALREAQKILDEADQIGVQVTTIATLMVQVAKQYTMLMSKAADQDDGTVFAGRMSTSVATAQQQLSSLTEAEMTLLKSFLDQVFA